MEDLLLKQERQDYLHLLELSDKIGRMENSGIQSFKNVQRAIKQGIDLLEPDACTLPMEIVEDLDALIDYTNDFLVYNTIKTFVDDTSSDKVNIVREIQMYAYGRKMLAECRIKQAMLVYDRTELPPTVQAIINRFPFSINEYMDFFERQDWRSRESIVNTVNHLLICFQLYNCLNDTNRSKIQIEELNSCCVRTALGVMESDKKEVLCRIYELKTDISRAYLDEIDRRITFLKNIDNEEDRNNAGIFLARFTKCGQYMNAILGFEKIMTSGVDSTVCYDIMKEYYESLEGQADVVKTDIAKAIDYFNADIFIRDKQVVFYGKTSEYAVNNRVNSQVK